MNLRAELVAAGIIRPRVFVDGDPTPEPVEVAERPFLPIDGCGQREAMRELAAPSVGVHRSRRPF